MIATPVRRRRAPLQGRKHCSSCTRWRHVIDYRVMTWVDLEKTTPRKLSAACITCARAKDRIRNAERRRRLRGEPCSPTEIRGATAIIRAMSKEDRHEYHVTGCLPLTLSWGAADEDHDPTPVPQGCPACYMRGGHPCDTCPDPDARAKARAAVKQRVVSLVR